MRYTRFNIHGDNIVECERTVALVASVLGDSTSLIRVPDGSPLCPTFRAEGLGTSSEVVFTCFPGFGRWDQDIIQHVRDRGGSLREATDAILTGIDDGSETPLLGIEYCGALPAGNQAWQRCGRAYSFGLAGVPFLYVAELGGYELDSLRARKAARLPNPAVPFSYICHSNACATPVLPVFTASPGADTASRDAYESVIGEQELASIVRAIIVGEPYGDFLRTLEEKVLNFVRTRAASSRRNCTLSPDMWSDAFEAVAQGTSLSDFLLERPPISWSKTAYIKGLTSTARDLMAAASQYAVGLTSSDLPMCLVSPDMRPGFAKEVASLYPELPREFSKWLGQREPLAICWVMGFKPRGDDARPDRGLPPMTRMLIGPGCDMLTVVYGPAPSASWSMLMNDPGGLAERNGLWEAILEPSNALLVDSATDEVTSHGFLRRHWETQTDSRHAATVLVSPRPTRYGEQDVDTALHVCLCRLGQAHGVFEGMCNPPGGDWSGISLLTEDRATELRWMSLPRVGGKHAKRPDHVFQLFEIAASPVLLIIESKELPRAVEARIGPRLKAYLSDLLATPASVERPADGQDVWSHSERQLSTDDLILCSAVAFLGAPAGELASFGARTDADIMIALEVSTDGTSCCLRLHPRSATGELVAGLMQTLPLEDFGFELATL